MLHERAHTSSSPKHPSKVPSHFKTTKTIQTTKPSHLPQNQIKCHPSLTAVFFTCVSHRYRPERLRASQLTAEDQAARIQDGVTARLQDRVAGRRPGRQAEVRVRVSPVWQVIYASQYPSPSPQVRMRQACQLLLLVLHISVQEERQSQVPHYQLPEALREVQEEQAPINELIWYECSLNLN